jgi:EAL domain-containing protein (putative c-di-GMP-specific phosphodiesterase class I)/serine phosphatase RsbU (regulator of sigma subunit)
MQKKSLMNLLKNKINPNRDNQSEDFYSHFLTEKSLIKLEKAFGKHDIGLMIIKIDKYYPLVKLYGEETGIRLLDLFKRNAFTLFYVYLPDCTIISIEKKGADEYIFYFLISEYSAEGLSSSALSLRKAVISSLEDELFDSPSLLLDVLVGHAVMRKNCSGVFRKCLFQAFCDARMSALQRSGVGQMRLHGEFLDILEKSDLSISFQSISDVFSGIILGWQSITQGPENSYFSSTEALFSHAEETGNLNRLDILAQKLILDKFLPESQEQRLFIMTNPESGNDPSHGSDAFQKNMWKNHLKPGNIVFEISERLCHPNIGLAAAKIEYYRKHGYGIALTNAGTGHMSLGDAASIRPDFIKIGDALTRKIGSTPLNQVIVKSYVDLARQIGARTIAGGIKTAAEFNSLSSMGIHFGQGDYLAGPNQDFPASKKKLPAKFSMEEMGKSESKGSTPIHDLVQATMMVEPATSIQNLLDLLANSSPISSVVAVNNRKPVGLLMKFNLDRKLGTRYGHSLFSKRSIHSLMDNHPLIVEIDTPLEQVARIAMSREPEKLYDDIIIVENEMLTGTISVQKMLETLLDVAKKDRDAAKADNEKIRSSLRYAKVIQESMLPDLRQVKTWLPDSFFIWMPRDIVSGDLYFTKRLDDGFMIVIADGTGHGVPGGFMTMIAYSGLRRIIVDERCTNPGEILKRLNILVKTTLQQDKPGAISNDGLDAAVCHVVPGRRELTFAGARLPMVFIPADKIHTIKGDRQSIGYTDSNLDFEFKNHKLRMEKGTSVYLYTDGYVDQLGGKERLPFGNKPFRNLLKNHYTEPFDEQRDILLKTFQNFRGKNDRQDDVTVIGFRF